MQTNKTITKENVDVGHIYQKKCILKNNYVCGEKTVVWNENAQEKDGILTKTKNTRNAV